MWILFLPLSLDSVVWVIMPLTTAPLPCFIPHNRTAGNGASSSTPHQGWDRYVSRRPPENSLQARTPPVCCFFCLTPTPSPSSSYHPSPLPSSPTQYISGAIMFDETLYQKTAAGVPFVDVLREQDILPGIKVDTGLQMIAGTDGETATQGLDGLGDRCKK